jgi:hypothetical protein
MTEEKESTLTVTVNKQEQEIPDDFGSTPEEFLEACGYDGDDDKVYRVTDLSKRELLTSDDVCKEPMVVSDGDEFVVIPSFVDGA